MPCEECRDLSTHEFRTADDLINAVRVAAEELNRGVLVQVGTTSREPAADEALGSALASGALPALLHYRFRCQVCGDHFALIADTEDGEGSWTRESGKVAP
jgi:hypothetical protein